MREFDYHTDRAQRSNRLSNTSKIASTSTDGGHIPARTVAIELPTTERYAVEISVLLCGTGSPHGHAILRVWHVRACNVFYEDSGSKCGHIFLTNRGL